MLEIRHEFQTIDGETVTVTLKNTMRHDIRYRVLIGAHATDDHADAPYRNDFCYFVARITNVEGTSWRPPMEGTTPEKFDKCYHGFAEMVDDETFYACVKAAIAMKQRTDPMEKPDAALTKEDQADPNS